MLLSGIRKGTSGQKGGKEDVLIQTQGTGCQPELFLVKNAEKCRLLNGDICYLGTATGGPGIIAGNQNADLPPENAGYLGKDFVLYGSGQSVFFDMSGGPVQGQVPDGLAQMIQKGDGFPIEAAS